MLAHETTKIKTAQSAHHEDDTICFYHNHERASVQLQTIRFEQLTRPDDNAHGILFVDNQLILQ